MIRKKRYKPKKHLRRKRGVVILRLPRYTDEEIKKIEEELAKAVNDENGWVDASVYFGKDVKFVSVYVGDKTHVKAEYHKVKGRKVYIKPYPKRANKENDPDFRL